MVSRHPAHPRDTVRRSPDGFGVVEVIVALVVFATGALGAAALTAHAARMAVRAQRREAVTIRATMLLDSLVQALATGSGSREDPVAEYRWSAAAEGAALRIHLEATPLGAADTIRLDAYRIAPPPVLGSW